MILLVLSVAVLLYAGLILYLLYTTISIPREKAETDDSIEDNVSIIIPCKNEALHLPGLFLSLQRQQFNAGIEIIIVDDGSTDTTKALVEQYKAGTAYDIKYIPSTFCPEAGLTSKQQAIDAGIHEAKYDIVVLTDADMLFDPVWLRTFFTAFDTTTDLVYGHTAIQETSSLFALLQSFQLAFLFSIASVFHYAGIQGSCMGNNLMIRKKTYLGCGGQNALGYSITEDRALLAYFMKCKKKVAITTPFHPKAFTFPHRNMMIFMGQMMRWAKGGFKDGRNLLLFALLFSMENIALILSVVGYTDIWCRIGSYGNFFITWIVMVILFKKNRAPVSPWYFPLFYIFFLIETLLFPLLLLSRNKIIWKGRTI